MIESIVKQYEDARPTDPSEAFSILISSLNEIRKNLNTGSLQQRGYKDDDISNIYTRLASRITQSLTAEVKSLNIQQLREAMKIKTIIHYIFSASGYRTSKHVISRMSEDLENQKISLSSENALIYLAISSLDDVSDELVNITLKQPKEILYLLLVGWLGQRSVLSEQGEKNRTKLLQNSHLISGYKLQEGDLPLLARAWMLCSYAAYPNKHDIKRHLNELIQDYLSPIIPPAPHFVSTKRPKKRVCVVIERFRSHHAMYRCYANPISSLREKFEIIGVGRDQEFDEVSQQIFDSVLLFDHNKMNFQDMVAAIRRLQPDIIYFPSIGMSLTNILLSNLRVAPLQIATLGHPATVNSGFIDSIFVGNALGSYQKHFSEKTYRQNGESYSFSMHPDLQDAFNLENENVPLGINIAVNCKVLKLSNSFLSICEKIQKSSKQSINFHFFPGELGINHDGLTAQLKNRLANVKVYGYMKYKDMMSVLKACDLSLVSYPFGNANGALDCAIFGVPSVYLTGTEVHSQSDEMIHRSIGATTWGSAGGEEEYLSKALKLINDKTMRRELGRELQYSSETYFKASACAAPDLLTWIEQQI